MSTDDGVIKKDRTEYFQAYYEEKREELSRKKKERYDKDPEFRERAKQKAKEYREKKRIERDRLREEGLLPKPSLKRGPRKPVKVMIGGNMHEAYSVTTVANRIRRSVNTINYWTKMRLLPETPLRRGGERLYTTYMISVLKLEIAKRGKVRLGDVGFYEAVRSEWAKTGVFTASIEIILQVKWQGMED